MKNNLERILSISQNFIDKSEVSNNFIQPVYSYIKAIGSTIK